MIVKRYDFALTILNNYIYIIGGKTTNRKLIKSCEKYDIKQNWWFKFKDINDFRFAATA